MQATHCDDSVERRQFDFIQRIGRIGYWEYDGAERTLLLPHVSRDILADIVKRPVNACPSFLEVLHGAERKRFLAALDQAQSARLALNIELQLARSDGVNAHVVVRGAAVGLDPNDLRFAGTFQDITTEKQRDREYEAVITQLQALLDALPQGVSVNDKNLNLILWNRRFYETLDFPQSMVFKNARFEDFIRFNAARGEYGPGDPQAQVQAIVERARQFLPHRFERQLTGGRTILVEGLPFKSGGEISGFVTTYTDITDQRHTEEQLTRQRDEMKTIIDNFPGAISLCNADLRFTAYNDQLMELLDFPPALFAKGWVDFEDLVRFNVNRGEYGTGDPEQQVQIVMERARNFQAHRIERARPNGRWLEIRGTPIPSGGFVSSYIDITERKRIEVELVQAKETAEARREQVASLLDHSGQGFLSFGSDLLVEAQCSRACETMLGLNPAASDAAQVLFGDDAVQADLLRETVAAVLQETDPWQCETMLSLLPSEFRRGDLLLKAEYKLLENQRLMVVLTDVTGERLLEREVEVERRHLEMIVAAVTDSRDFFDTVETFGEFTASGLAALLSANLAPDLIVRELYRQVHTFKGLLNQFSFTQTPLALHALESDLEKLRHLGLPVSCQHIADTVAATPLAALFDADLTVLRDALGTEFLDSGDRIVVSAAQAGQLQQLAEQLLRGAPIDTTVGAIRKLLLEISQLRKISVKDALSGFDRLIKLTAQRLDKEVATLGLIGGDDVWIDPQNWRPFLRSLTHIFRNAIVHGIEDAATRLELGKPEVGSVHCTVQVVGNELQLNIADDGAGIDLEALRRRAVAVGLYAPEAVATLDHEQLLDLIFLDNISTQQATTELAGRGIGLAVVRSETRKLRGEVAVRTRPGQGTQFLFALPLQSDIFRN